jgi:hypothetical protein
MGAGEAGGVGSEVMQSAMGSKRHEIESTAASGRWAQSGNAVAESSILELKTEITASCFVKK